MFANTQATAMNMSPLDVCKTIVGPAVVPIPYPNIATTDTAIPVVLNVLIQVMPSHNLLTVTPMSNGDEAGTATGVVSNLIMGPSTHELGSLKVMLMAAPATKLTSVTGQNGAIPNAPGLTISPSQVKILYLC